MSGDVQPRKRKDKKKKKDDLFIDEPRGTAAALGEGDVFMHSPQDHGTGGHWCAKIIFFSLLAVLVTLIGLIILENRGLSELQVNSVESKYSGVLEGWIEDAHDDDHHDEHTLELHHHDDEDDEDDDHGLDHGDDDESQEEDHDENDEEQSQEADEDDDDERNQYDDDEKNQDDDEDDDEINEDDDEDERNQDEDDDESREVNNEKYDDQDDTDSQQVEDDDDDNVNSEEQKLEADEDEDEVEEPSYRRYYRSAENQAHDDDDDDDDDNDKKGDDKDADQSIENDDDDQQDEANDNSQEDDDDDQQYDSEENDDELKQLNINEENSNKNSDENDDQDEDDQDHADHNDHSENDDVELEHIEDEVFDEDVSTETPAKKYEESEEVSKEATPIADDEDEVELLEPDELDELPEELPMPTPKGRPLVEVEESSSTEKPQDTLADEEEYERQQEALRKEKEQASQGMWLKLVVGGALLVATQAVLRRATAPRENEDEVHTTREDTPLSDRRMTLIAEPLPPPVTPKPQEASRPVVQKEVVRQEPVVRSGPPPTKQDDYDEEEEIVVSKDMKQVAAEKDTIDKELYSDEEEDVEDEDIEEEKEEPPKSISKPVTPAKEPPKPPVKEIHKPAEKKEPPKVVEKEPTPEAEDDDDVEIIEEEDIGEEEEEEEISDVDDIELLNRLEAKYGRLPDPERPGRKKGGGNSIEDEWPGEPSDAYWRDELDHAERDLRQGEWSAAAERASAAKLRASARARYVVARALDFMAEAKRDNGLLSKAIAAYLELLKINEKLSDKKLIEITDRALDRMKFRGNYLGTEPLYRLLIRRFPDDPAHRNNLTVAFLMANRVDLAEDVIKETLTRWPNDRLALAHHAFILKTLHNKLEQAVDAFTKALEGDIGPANEPRFYYHLGDSLLLLGRFQEAHEVHKRGAKLGHFLSPAQRSLYNVDRLKSKPWWDVEKTPYARLARALEKSWKEILKEGRAAQALYEKEKEGLKERGEWSQLDLFVRGREVPGRCSRAPVTCGIVRSEVAASGCRRGQVKFSSMEAGTHVRPHVGPTNCRLRMHLGLSNTKGTHIRVDQETRQWQTGKVLMFDDSFEHEVWHNGTGTRLVLIVDVWHPDLTRTERAQLPAI